VIEDIKWDDGGLVPAIVQDADTCQVLMLAYMNRESLQLTLASGETHFWSRSRQELWHKGATSGNTQRVLEIRYDCDADTLLVQVEPAGPACHTGEQSCFYRTGWPTDGLRPSADHPSTILDELFAVIQDRRQHMPANSYTTYLFEKGPTEIAKKVGEEVIEVVVASAEENLDHIIYESADLIYHLLVLLAEHDIAIEEVYAELAKRRK
jgi:phosphoribosyl-ATP pyrophosphohydrolase/phosphoribosyl-AMP cyclohydrolase